MVYVPLAVVKVYMENRWRDRGGKPETRGEQRQEILLQWYIWLDFYPTDYRALSNFNSHLAEHYDGRFRVEVGATAWS